MSSKRSKHELLESPPSASPSSNEDEDSSSEEEEEEEAVTPHPNPQSSSESGSDSESDRPETLPEPVPVKPQPQPLSKKTSSKPAATPKRPLEKKPKLSADGGSAKISTPRVWSEDEEVAILKAMIDYEEKIGQSPSVDMEAFHAFVKKSLSTDASRNQVYEKLRRLKKKYWDNVGKLKKEGASSSSLKPHDKRLFDLSKKIWRNEANGGLQSPSKTDKSVKSAAKPKKKETQSVGKPVTPKLTPMKLETTLTPAAEEPEPEPEPEKEMNLAPLTSLADNLRSLAPFMSSAVSESCKDMQDYVIEEGLKLMNGAQRAEFEERWAKLQNELLQHVVEKNKLVHENSKVIMDAKK